MVLASGVFPTELCGGKTHVLVMLQMTISKRHSVSYNGLNEVSKQVNKFFPNNHRVLVFGTVEKGITTYQQPTNVNKTPTNRRLLEYSFVMETNLATDLEALQTRLVKAGSPLIGVGKDTEHAAHVAERTALVAQQANLKEQQNLAVAELAGTMRGGGPPLKRLQLANDSAGGKVGFFNHVLVRYPLNFSQQGVIQLGMGLWGDPDKHQFLINRHFDVGKELALAFIQKRAPVLVAGSKGIGKSCLGLVIVDTLFKEDRIVAYEYSNTQMLLVPSKDALDSFATKITLGYFAQSSFHMVDKVGLYKFIQQDGGTGLFRDLCLSTDLVHVVDVGELYEGVVESSFPKIVISSPNSDKLKRFGDIQSSLNYIIYPAWTWEEIVGMNSKLESMQQADDVLKLKFELFGGVPRLIFKVQTVEEAMEESKTPGKKCNVRFASEYIAQLVIKRYAQMQRVDLMTLLNAMDGPPRMMSAMQGYLLEEVMHGALLSNKPSKFQLLELQAQAPPKNSCNVQFPVLTEVQFSRKDMSDIVAMKKNDYFRPTFPTFKSVESFAIVKKSVLSKTKRGFCIVAFQATVSDDHPLKRAGLKDIQEKVKALYGDQLELYVVFVTNKGKGITKRQKLGADDQNLDANYLQYVLYGMELEDVVIKSTG
ncbi:hypothetical protein BASA81_007599 [Batrachochytrium salamandrivorans]|nr:hypothetical protein BASA81_007599 [Batrachochytrium salamandrivorans]